jgi:hypothetical protein
MSQSNPRHDEDKEEEFQRLLRAQLEKQKLIKQARAARAAAYAAENSNRSQNI